MSGLLDCKAPIKIIKKGKTGCEYIGENKSFVAETQEREVVDKTGAGDVVIGVFLAMMAETNNEEEALKTAVKVATESVGHYGVDFFIERRNDVDR